MRHVEQHHDANEPGDPIECQLAAQRLPFQLATANNQTGTLFCLCNAFPELTTALFGIATDNDDDGRPQIDVILIDNSGEAMLFGAASKL